MGLFVRVILAVSAASLLLAGCDGGGGGGVIKPEAKSPISNPNKGQTDPTAKPD